MPESSGAKATLEQEEKEKINIIHIIKIIIFFIMRTPY
jgi:hypothetical protein